MYLYLKTFTDSTLCTTGPVGLKSSAEIAGREEQRLLLEEITDCLKKKLDIGQKIKIHFSAGSADITSEHHFLLQDQSHSIFFFLLPNK